MNDSRPSFSLARRSSALLNMAISVGAILALGVMVNYLAVRHFRRFSVNSDTQSRLSPQTLEVLGRLTNAVHVTVYYDPDDDLYPRVTGLLREYQSASLRIEVERVDYLRDVAAARAVKARYKLTRISDKNLVIFECGDNQRVVSSGELSEYDVKGFLAQRTNEVREVRRSHFRGELAFTSAIFSVSNPRRLKAYFLHGHGEHNPESTDQALGYSKFAAILKEECNIPWDRLSLLTSPEVPADCSLLVIAGPTNPFSREELAKLQKYLNQGGRLLALFNYYSLGKPTGLEKLLAQYDVTVGDNLVVDVEHSPPDARGTRGKGIVPTFLGNHPIVSRLVDADLYLILPRTIERTPSSASRPSASDVEELLFTGPNSQVVTDIRRGMPQMNPTLDRRGAVPLMAVAERGAVPGVSAERGATRLAVIGDSLFLENDAIESVFNRDFAAHVVNWLVDQAVLLKGVAPRPIKYYRIMMTQAQLSATRWLLLVMMPGSVLFLGAIVGWRRRT